MTTRTRIYAVRDRKTGQGQLVRAPSAATAVRMMADSLYSVDVATQEECVELAAHGVLDERAVPTTTTNEPAPERTETVVVPSDAWPYPTGKAA